MKRRDRRRGDIVVNFQLWMHSDRIDRQGFLKIAERFPETIYAPEGCYRSRFLQHLGDKTRFGVVQDWQGRDAFHDFISKDNTQLCFRAVDKLCASVEFAVKYIDNEQSFQNPKDLFQSLQVIWTD